MNLFCASFLSLFKHVHNDELCCRPVLTDCMAVCLTVQIGPELISLLLYVAVEIGDFWNPFCTRSLCDLMAG